MSPDAQLNPASVPGESFDRTLARQWLREQIAQEPPVLVRIAGLHKEARSQVVRACWAKKERSRQDRLRSTPVTGLLRKNADVNPQHLVGAGVFTADHILELGASKLAARAHIDANAAAKWVNAARDVKRKQDGDEIPGAQPAQWAEEDVALVRALLVLDSVTVLRFASHTQGLAYVGERARVLLDATSWMRWKLNAGKHAGVIADITELAEWISSGRAGSHGPQVESHLARHLTMVDELRDPNEVARLWGYRRDDLLELLREEAL
ncbi:aldo-keto reductase family protein [Streptomyces hiroshimensis]|uniref:Uncharacterized protein n=1 Tax=Streptomyces hiroshimensis TaxID=66424 RepID=A0ABQ2ZCT1_9ACTN|nr:hypothetical protein [Streptomyces hiroshimensis]GGY10983.1 hypothetical protein GCM10010324_67280 [Streptomyces hiroshimensis]